ncbi:hypothetical protein J3B02_002815 [Coemansia erecta]|nr:hypothetical protein J3B02_002815 [Coemansia erecta]
MTNQSLFDFIHPDEATRARRDLVDTFVSKSLFGSGIRCRLRRFDLERLGGFQHIFRRASESHILHQSHHHAQHVHEAFERKMSLPIIPDMARMRSVGHTNHAFHHHHHHHMPLQSHPPSTNPMHQPMPKRLRTILEDSIGPLAAEQRGDDKTSALNNSARAGIKIKIKDTSDQTCSGSSGGGSSEEQARGCEDVARCCISHIDSVATNVADMNNGLGDGGCNNSEYLIANIGLYLVSSRLSIMVCHYEDSPKSRGLLPLCSADNFGGGSGGTTTPVAEVESALSNYNIQTPPSENPLRISATAELGFRLDQNCSLSTSHPHLPATLSSYPGPGASTSTNTSTSTSAGSTFASVQQQQQQQQQTQQPQHRPMARFLPAVHQQSFGHLSAVPESRPFSIPRAPASVAANLPVRPPVTLTPPDTSVPPRRQSSYTLPPVKSFEERRFSYPIQALNGDTSRPQPPPPPPPPSQPHSQHQSLGHSSGHSSGPGTSSSAIGGPNSASTAGISVRGSPVSMTGGPGTATFSPGGRLLELRQRAMFGANLRIGGAMSSAKSMGELSSTQPTPTISPLTASIVQHTPVSLSPAPQTQPHSASSVASGSFQVNMYPPSDTPESWRWSQGTAPATSHHRQQQQQQQQQNQQQQHLHHHPHQYHQHHMLLQKHGAQSFSAVSSQKPPPPLPISRAANHPLHYGALHASIQDHYQSPISSVVASPSIVGTPSSAPATQQRINGDPDKKMCKSCGTDTSPEWRKGPTGHKT